MKEALLESAHAYKEGRMDRRTFLMLCGVAGIATQAVIAGDAEAAADEAPASDADDAPAAEADEAPAAEAAGEEE